jgi:putative flavoprotein involved in K+ transport
LDDEQDIKLRLVPGPGHRRRVDGHRTEGGSLSGMSDFGSGEVTAAMSDEIDVVVVGAGQAGLSCSHELTEAGVEHVVLERDRVGAAWHGRWDSFCLVIPNDTIRLPGGEYRGDDPHGFLPRDRVVGHLEGYAAGFGAPVRTGVNVVSLDQAHDGSLVLGTGDGNITARAVVVSTGAYQRAHRPAAVASLPSWLPVLDTADYRNPGMLPDGAVLVIGSGQTGCQIAEEIRLTGRDVALVCGRAPWIPRRLEGRDMAYWLLETPFFEMSVAELPGPASRLLANAQNTGVGGGHDLNCRTLAALGVTLTGRLVGANDDTAYFADDLADSVSFGDARYADVRALISRTRLAGGLPVPEMPVPAPFLPTARGSLKLRGLGCAIVTAGYRPAYEWVHPADAFDNLGFPLHENGASTAVPGLYFVGVHFLRKRKSSLLIGVGEDATLVAEQVAQTTAP